MTVVDRFFNELVALTGFLSASKEVSFQVSIDDYFRKNLLLCAASHFEHRLTTDVHNYGKEISGHNTLLPSFLRSKAIARQYHTWFEWKGRNANSFFALFGDDFEQFMKAQVKSSKTLQIAIRDFLQLGSDRNRLVHQDFGTFVLEKTPNEIYAQYQSASSFVNNFPMLLRKCPITDQGRNI